MEPIDAYVEQLEQRVENLLADLDKEVKFREGMARELSEAKMELSNLAHERGERKGEW